MTCNFQRTSLDLFQIHWILAVFTIEYDLICIYGDYVPSSILLHSTTQFEYCVLTINIDLQTEK